MMTGRTELISKEDGEYLAMLSFDQSQQNKDKLENGEEEESDEDKVHPAVKIQLRQNSIVSSNEEAPTTQFTKEEDDVEAAGWSVLLKYFKVR